MTAAERKRKQRQRAFKLGKCPRCPVYKANWLEPWEAMCVDCRQRQEARLARLHANKAGHKSRKRAQSESGRGCGDAASHNQRERTIVQPSPVFLVPDRTPHWDFTWAPTRG
jgi:hypothetical protein